MQSDPLLLFQAGDMLDARYKMGEPLSIGPTSHVYAARHVHTEMELAIKVVVLTGTPSAIESQIERLRREATTVGQLGHPNVVTVHDFGFVGTDRTRPYLAMDRLQGHTLATEITQAGSVGVDRVMQLMLPCLGALAKAHALGVVHNALVPQNLFLSDPGEPGERLTILDFSGSERHDGATVDPSVDVLQMGFVIADMLGGSVSESATPVLSAEVLDGPFGPVLGRATATDPAERFPDASALAEALAGWDDPADGAVTPAPMTAAAVGPAQTPAKPKSTLDSAAPARLGLMLGAGGLCLLVLALAIGFVVTREDSAPPLPPSTAIVAPPTPASAEAWRNIILSYDQTAEALANRSLLAAERDRAVQELKHYELWELGLTHADANRCVEALQALVKIPVGHELRGRPRYEGTTNRCKKDAVEGLLRLAQTAMVQAEWSMAKKYLNDAEAIDPSYPGLDEAKDQLTDARGKKTTTVNTTGAPRAAGAAPNAPPKKKKARKRQGGGGGGFGWRRR